MASLSSELCREAPWRPLEQEWIRSVFLPGEAWQPESMGLQRVGQDRATDTFTSTFRALMLWVLCDLGLHFSGVNTHECRGLHRSCMFGFLGKCCTVFLHRSCVLYSHQQCESLSSFSPACGVTVSSTGRAGVGTSH